MKNIAHIASYALALILVSACAAPLATPAPLNTQRLLPVSENVVHDMVVYSFQGGNNGIDPRSTLLAGSKGELFGMTYTGGTSNDGTVFELVPSGKAYKEKWVHSFKGGSDGSNPLGALIEDKSGSLYGTTEYGGAANDGTVFKISSSGSNYKQIYSFAGNDGSNPPAGLLAGKNGVFYGETSNGGTSGQGTIFELRPARARYKEALIHSFQGGQQDAAHPQNSLILYKAAFYGPASGGGPNCYGECGTIFKVTLKGKSTVAFDFDNTDGSQPQGSPVIDSAGRLYGTTSASGGSGQGTVFVLTPSGSSYNMLCWDSFTGNNGAYPVAGVTSDGTAFYGVTQYGGYSNAGAIFKLVLSGSKCSESVVYSFQGGNDASFPFGALIVDGGRMFGTGETGGGPKNDGAVFYLKP